RTKQQVRLGFLWLCDPALADPAVARAVCREVLEPLEVQLDEQGRAVVASRTAAAHPRAVRVVRGQPTPLWVGEDGHFMVRGVQPAHDRGEWLHVYHRGTAPVQLDARRAGPRPGPGCTGSMALCGAATDQRVVVRLLQVGPLLRAPSIEMPVAFDAVELDGKPWRYFAGRRVVLPRRAGRYEVVVRSSADDAPRLCSTGATVEECQFDRSAQVLRLRLAPDSVDGATAWVSGQPTAVEGGELLPESEFAYPPEQQRIAVQHGAVVRLQAPEVRIHYGRRAAQSAPAEAPR
ncbi:MAG: hypothetical protein KDC87_06725, partial [Planctomycetes bacterium]|nr:hypothetical protein [Planctomycetota bacterium]